ncbi:MAG: phage tail sheath family protein [bacterium]|nr:phage tail sheath family protein [bacterium]
MLSPSYPGVYIEEIPSGVRPITGVATSVAAFIGYFSRGPLDQAVQIFSRGDFERELGGLRADSEAAYAIEQFFLNGGTQAWVARTAVSADSAAVVLQDDGGNPVLTVTATSPGVWGDNVRLDVDYGTTEPSTSFNLTVSELDSDGNVARTESFRNLTIAAGPRHAADVVNDGSKLIRVAVDGDAAARPAATGTISDQFTSMPTVSDTDALTVTLGSDSVTTDAVGTPVPSTLASLAQSIQSLIRAKAGTGTGLEPFARNVTVSVAGSIADGAYLVVKAGSSAASDTLALSGTLATALGLEAANHENVQQYALDGDTVAFQTAAGTGADGTLPDGAALTAALAAFDKVDLFNIMSVPDTVRLADAEAASVMAEATAYCEKRRAFYVLDIPHKDTTRDEMVEAVAWIDENATLRHKNAALYYPRPMVADPLNGYRPRAVAPSGTVAGLYSRTDTSRGVWKAPAGTDVTLSGVQKLEDKLSDAENGVLNPLAVNCLRNIPPYGNIAWGARTLVGADQLASEWKYVPVRRLALFLEESLYRGLHWVVFEPNDEPLWGQIRLNTTAFMQNLFRQGAFQGQTPSEAYLVKCDRETTTQADIDLGIVNIVVGFAPLKPAEFVIIKLQQLAGQTQA